MHKIVLYCKSYRGDLERVKVLYNSIQQHNTDNIPFYISIPKADENLFAIFEKAHMLFDEDIYNVTGPGWLTQQIVKSSFWKLKLCENYVLIDSDSYFIKPFSISDFMFDKILLIHVCMNKKNFILG
jgi:hypothetical protein